MSGHDLIVIGASAGGLQALQALVAALPPELAASVLVVLHTEPQKRSELASVLDRAGPLPAQFASDKAPLEPGRIYVAPPDHHLLVERQRMRVVRGPRENRHRPAIDVLFRSAAWSFGPRVVAVILSGTLDDGTAGMWAVKTCGGVCIVQDPDDAQFGDMPRNALNSVEVDHCLPLPEIAPLLVQLARRQVTDVARRPPPSMQTEVEFAMLEHDIREMGSLGVPTGFTCPNCHGSLWELKDGELVHYRCHVGHAFSPDSLLAEQSLALEEALYSAVRALEEKGAVLRRMGERFHDRHPEWSRDYHARAKELDERADVLRGVLAQQEL